MGTHTTMSTTLPSLFQALWQKMAHPWPVTLTQPPVAGEGTIDKSGQESGCFQMEQGLLRTVSQVMGSIGSDTIKYSDSIVKVISRLHWEPTAVEYLTIVEWWGHSVPILLVSFIMVYCDLIHDPSQQHDVTHWLLLTLEWWLTQTKYKMTSSSLAQ